MDLLTYAQLCKKVPLVTVGCPKFTHKNCPFPFYNNHPSNKPIPRPTPLTIANGIRIHLAILPWYTFQTQTDKHTDRQMV